MTARVDDLAPGDCAPSAALLARAFASDPGTKHITAGLAEAEGFERELFEAILRREFESGAAGLAARDASGGLVGLALIHPPGVESAPLKDWLKDWSRARSLLRRPLACWRAWRLQHSIDRLRPQEENRLYLKVLAVDPPAQGLGAGALLLEAVMARAKQTGSPVHLETFRRENVAYYKARGFVLLAEIAPQGLPHFWQLRRKPA